MNEQHYGTFTDAGTLQFTRVLKASADSVWDYLTKPDKRGEWLAGRKPKPFWEVHSALEEHYQNHLGLQ